MNVEIPRADGDGFPNGHWRLVRRDGQLGANLSCPDCGVRGGLGHGTNHVIDDRGQVTPSVVCDCGWHVHVTLVGWSAVVLAGQ